MKINKYPDGTSYISKTSIEPFIAFKINSYEDLWHLNQYVDAYNSDHSREIRLTVTIPNLLDAQADRRFNLGESSGLKLVCKFLNGIDADFKIFHPHNPEVVEAMMDNVEIMDNHEFIGTVLNDYFHMDANPHPKDHPNNVWDDFILMSSDAGGFKPLMKLCDKLDWKGETYSASKARTESGMKQLIDRDDFRGKDIVIIDDICVYGGTFKGLARLLRERNCGKLYLAVSHMTVQNLGNDPVTNYFDEVFTTNSKFDEYYIPTKNFPGQGIPKNLEIIKLF